MAWSRSELQDRVATAIDQVLGRRPGSKRQAISPDARLGADLGLKSTAVARLAGLLQKGCGKGPLPFFMLFVKPDGSVLNDVRVSDLVAFLEGHTGEEKP